MLSKLKLIFLYTASSLIFINSINSHASPRGSEFGITQTPAAGGMSGVGVVRPQDPAAMLFGNPSTLTQLKTDNAFTLGAQSITIDLNVENSGGSPFLPIRTASSDLDIAILPNATFLHRLSDKAVLGLGLTGISGLGGDYRSELPELPAISDLKLFGTNVSIGYQITKNLSLGGTVSLGIGSLQIGLVQNSASVNALGIGAGFGATYDFGKTQVGIEYRSPLSMDYKNVIETDNNVFTDLELEQPQGVAIGWATTDLLWDDFFIEADIGWKNWSNAEGYRDIWKDQYTFSLGAQKNIKNWRLRAGYTYSNDILRSAGTLGNNIGDIETVFLPDGGPNGEPVTLPVSPALIQVFQSTVANGYWRQNITMGLGIDLNKDIVLDINAGASFDGTRRIEPGLEAEGRVYYVGAGITWNL